MRLNAVSPLVRQTVNGVLALIVSQDQELPAEAAMAAQLGVSRTPLQRALKILRQRRVLHQTPGRARVARLPQFTDRYQTDAKVQSKAESFKDRFLAKLAQGVLRPGQQFSELELAQEAGLSTVPVREALLAISSLGLIVKAPRRQWSVVRFSCAMVDELYELRMLLELDRLARAMAISQKNQVDHTWQALLEEHQALQRGQPTIDGFLDLDQRFHATLFQVGGNRFIAREFSAIAILLRFQLQPVETGLRGMVLGLEQHQPILGALLDRDQALGQRLMREHLCTSRELMKHAVNLYHGNE